MIFVKYCTIENKSLKKTKMFDCMIIGDSIAVGVSHFRRECVVHAKSGWNSERWNKDYLAAASAHPVQTVIISLGANDYKGTNTEHHLRVMRAAIKGKRVFWIGIGPDRKPAVQAAIEKVASENGDTVLKRPDRQLISADGVHPTYNGYKKLAEQTK